MADAYPDRVTSVVFGPLILLLDLAAVGGLVVASVVTGRRLRSSQLARPSVALRRWTTLIVLLAALGLVVVGNVAAVRSVIASDNQGRPAPAQVIGTWTDSDGATLQVRPDGTFAAAGLPTDSNDAASDGKPHPAGGHGTWHIVRWQGAWSVDFILSGGSQFQFSGLRGSGSRAGPGTAWFSWVFAQFNAVNLWEFYRR